MEPPLLCQSPEKVQSVLKDYVKQTPFRNFQKITLQLLECPTLIAVACLTKQNNVLADLATQDVLRQRLAGLKQAFSATDLLDLSVAPSSISGIHLLNVSPRTRVWIRIMIRSLINIFVKEATAVPPGPCA